MLPKVSVTAFVLLMIFVNFGSHFTQEIEREQREVDNLVQVLHQITEEARDDSFLTLYPAVRDKMKLLKQKCDQLESKPLPEYSQVTVYW